MFRDETGMSTTVTRRWIKAFGRIDDHCFANNELDDDGSTLVHDDCFFFPIRDEEQGGKLVISTYSPGYLPELEIDEIVMCYLQPSEGLHNDHTRAARWTTIDLWADAAKDYAIHTSTGNGRWELVKKFSGILDLSAEFGTQNWDDGVIGSSGTRLYRLDQLIVDPDGREFYHPLKHDPRLAPDELPREYRGRLILPQ